MERNKNTLLVLAGIAVVVISFVIIVSRAEAPPVNDQVVIIPEGETAELINPTKTVEVAEEIGEAEAGSPATETQAPTPRIGLQATDPTIVNLASGEIQLVEFFAFW